jgi:proteasome lid subunit RPN8/RPN11
MEACGLLAGREGAVYEVLPVTNRDQSPTSFRMDPAEQLRAFRWIEERGLDLVGIYHSHPLLRGAASAPGQHPSPTDIAEAAYPAVYLVWSRPRGPWQARGFWIENGHISEVTLQIEGAEKPS